MATLHVREVPDRLYEKLKKMAERENRSLTAQVVTLIEEALKNHDMDERSRKAFERIRATAKKYPLPEDTDVVAMIREDRER